jgi:hypothetical protein
VIDDPAVLRGIIHDLRQDYPGRDTFLDRCALAALAGLCGNSAYWTDIGGEPCYIAPEKLAEDSYRIAVAMMNEREKAMSVAAKPPAT